MPSQEVVNAVEEYLDYQHVEDEDLRDRVRSLLITLVFPESCQASTSDVINQAKPQKGKSTLYPDLRWASFERVHATLMFALKKHFERYKIHFENITSLSHYDQTKAIETSRGSVIWLTEVESELLEIEQLLEKKIGFQLLLEFVTLRQSYQLLLEYYRQIQELLTSSESSNSHDPFQLFYDVSFLRLDFKSLLFSHSPVAGFLIQLRVENMCLEHRFQFTDSSGEVIPQSPFFDTLLGSIGYYRESSEGFDESPLFKGTNSNTKLEFIKLILKNFLLDYLLGSAQENEIYFGSARIFCMKRSKLLAVRGPIPAELKQFFPTMIDLDSLSALIGVSPDN